MKWVIISISFFVIGLGIGYSDGIKSIEIWNDFYYVWDKIKDGLLFATLIFYVKNKYIKNCLIWVVSFCIIRIIWDVIAIRDFNYAASPLTMFIMFTVWGLLVTKMIVQGIIEEWQHF